MNHAQISSLMPLFHWPATPLRSHGVRKNNIQIRSRIAEMVWWNISGATISHVLRINCVSMAHGWRTWRMNGNATAYGVAHENLIIAYPRRKWRMHSVQPTYARRLTRFYGVWRAYAQRMGCVHAAPINTAHSFLRNHSIFVVERARTVNVTESQNATRLYSRQTKRPRAKYDDTRHVHC